MKRCDIHNGGCNPPRYVCRTCLKEFGIDPAPPEASRKRSLRSRLRRGHRRLRRRISRRDKRLMSGPAAALVVLSVVVIVIATARGEGGGNQDVRSGRPTEGGVVNAL
jgi:hypothetical protein